MAIEQSLGDLINENETANVLSILESLLNPENIDMKTHIISPVSFAVFEAIISDFDLLVCDIDKNCVYRLTMTKSLLETTRDKLKMFLISWNRESRKEITETLKSIREEGSGERSFFQRILGIHNK